MRHRDLAIEAIDVGLGLSELTLSAVRRLGGPLARAADSGVSRRLFRPRLQQLATRGRQVRSILTEQLNHELDVLAPVVVDAAVSRVDLTTLVRDHVDLDELATTLDLNRLAREQLDLIGLADYVIDGVDLPAIMRESSASFTTEAVRGVRMQGIEADQAVARVVDRLLPRRHGRSLSSPNGHVTG
jgi:hypothetical protein